MYIKALIFIFMLMVTSLSFAVESEGEYLSLGERMSKVNKSAISINLIKEVYYEYKIEKSSIYFMTAFFDSILDSGVKSELIKLRNESGKLDCRVSLLYKTYGMITDRTGPESVAGTLDEVYSGFTTCGLLNESEKLIILSRVLLNSLNYRELRESAWLKLLELNDRNDIGSYNLMARASYYYAMSSGGMKICLNNNFDNCNVHEKWNAYLVDITDQLRISSNYYLSNLFFKFVLTSAFSNTEEFGVVNPYIK